MPIPTAEERVGSHLAGKYRLDRILGRGGFGVVYAGVHEWTGRPIAVKVLNHDLCQQEIFVRRFLQEARAAAKLDHANVVDVLDMGNEADGTVYLVLELLEGEDLGRKLERDGPLRPSQALEILLPVMDALAEAHARGIVHRDLKPDNIFLSVDPKGRSVPKLLDFGIAKMADSGLGATSTGLVVGTPHYMAPEQARGLPDIGPPADVWSMGVVLWQCLTARVPFDAGTPTGVLAEILTKRPPPFGPLVPGLAPIASVVDRALEYDRNSRYSDMGEFLRALLDASASLGMLPSSVASLNTQPGTPPPFVANSLAPSATPTPFASVVPQASSRRGRLLMIASAMLVLGVSVFSAVALWPRSESEPPALASPPNVLLPRDAGTHPIVAADPVALDEPTADPRPALDGEPIPEPRPSEAAVAPAAPPPASPAEAVSPPRRVRARPRAEPMVPARSRPLVSPLPPNAPPLPIGPRNGANASPILH